MLVPVSGNQWDDEAIASYQEAMPGYEIIGINYSGWIDTDALHCRTKGIADLGMLYIHHVPILGLAPVQDSYELTAEITAASGQPIAQRFGVDLLFSQRRRLYDKHNDARNG